MRFSEPETLARAVTRLIAIRHGLQSNLRRGLTILTEVSRGLPQFRQAHAGLVPWTGPRPLSATLFAFHGSLIAKSSDAILLMVSWNSVQTHKIQRRIEGRSVNKNWKGCGRRRSFHNLRHRAGNYLEELSSKAGGISVRVTVFRTYYFFIIIILSGVRHFTVSDPRIPQHREPGPRIYIPQEQGGPVIPPGTGFPFHRLLRLAELQWRYSTPPPQGNVLDKEYLSKFIKRQT
jgi:hypothetical protein